MMAEPRLIDANGSYRLDADDYTGCAISFNDGIITVTNDDGCYICEFDAKKLPTVDAVEVVHGRWIYEEDTVMRWTTKAICSACKCVVAHNVELSHEYGRENHEKRNKYCPNCGAKMDGGNEDG